MSHKSLPSEARQKLQKFFESQKDVVGVWLYGSRMTGTSHAKSDSYQLIKSLLAKARELLS